MPTFEAYVLGQMKCSMLVANCVFCETTVWRHHFVETRNPIARFKLPDIASNTVYDSGDIVTTVRIILGDELRNFPIGGSAMVHEKVREQVYQSLGLLPLTTT